MQKIESWNRNLVTSTTLAYSRMARQNCLVGRGDSNRPYAKTATGYTSEIKLAYAIWFTIMAKKHHTYVVVASNCPSATNRNRARSACPRYSERSGSGSLAM